jgi:hypothetical protein
MTHIHLVLLWALCFILLYRALFLLKSQCLAQWDWDRLFFRRAFRELERIAVRLRNTEETLQAGLLPDQQHWNELYLLPSPWGDLIRESVTELRNRGCALVPTLKRLRSLAEEHSLHLAQARSKSAQPLMQVSVAVLLIPLFSGMILALVQAVRDSWKTWVFFCVLALLWAVLAWIWTLSMAEKARWGGVRAHRTSWILSALCAGERLLALVRSGLPPDVAWTRLGAALSVREPELWGLWGGSIWTASPVSAATFDTKLEQAILKCGSAWKTSIQVALMEGRPCLERLESSLEGVKQDLNNCVENELNLLPARALKPMFLCVAPALFGMVAFALFLCWQNWA